MRIGNSQFCHHLKDGAEYSPLRPTKPDKIKNLHVEVHPAAVGLAEWTALIPTAACAPWHRSRGGSHGILAQTKLTGSCWHGDEEIPLAGDLAGHRAQTSVLLVLYRFAASNDWVPRITAEEETKWPEIEQGVGLRFTPESWPVAGRQSRLDGSDPPLPVPLDSGFCRKRRGKGSGWSCAASKDEVGAEVLPWRPLRRPRPRVPPCRCEW